MTKKQTTIGSDTWEWEETEEVRKAVAKLHETKNKMQPNETARNYS